jgi:phage baseplate assembly protein W
MQIAFPFHIDSRRCTATASDSEHIRNLIEQVLFTSPGERVNRPDFGSGLQQLVFSPNTEELAPTVQSLVQGSLQQWLGELIRVDGVEVGCDENYLRVTVSYTLVRNGEQQETVCRQRLK